MRKILALGVLGAASFLIPAPSAQAGQPVIVMRPYRHHRDRYRTYYYDWHGRRRHFDRYYYRY
jgi:hypothetical protein